MEKYNELIKTLENYRDLPDQSGHARQPLGVIGLAGMMVLFAPGVMPCTWKAVQQKTIWGTFLLLGGAM